MLGGLALLPLSLLGPPRRSSPPRMGNKYGTKAYWDEQYAGVGQAAADGLPADKYEWYCGWPEIEPFWSELVPKENSYVAAYAYLS